MPIAKHAAVTSLAAMVLALTTLARAATAPLWIDAKTLVNWNARATQLPPRSGPRDPLLAPGGQCAGFVRPPTEPEDRALVARGWTLVGPYQRYGSLAVLMATSAADGMCRPNGFQGFVFVNGAFAGTLSPVLMNARTDASIGGLAAALYASDTFSVDYARYGAEDPLCCPHATTTVTFRIEPAGGRSRAVPVSATTQTHAPN
jgi:hypothetical protein